MPGNTCLVCGHTRVKDPNVSFHRFSSSSDQARRELWLRVFKLTGEQVKAHSRVWSRHFPRADPRNDPEMNIGKRFASPRKKGVRRAKRAKIREARKQLTILKSPSPSNSRCSTPATATSPAPSLDQERSFTTGIGEQLFTGYQVHELPHVNTGDASRSTSQLGASGKPEVVENTALLARIEVLEAENQHT